MDKQEQEIDNKTLLCIIQVDKIQAQVKEPQELSHLNETQGPKEHTDHLNEGYLAPFEV